MRVSVSPGKLGIGENEITIEFRDDAPLRCDVPKFIHPRCYGKVHRVVFLGKDHVEVGTFCLPEIKEWRRKDVKILILDGGKWSVVR